jgi:hypothetical protein
MMVILIWLSKRHKKTLMALGEKHNNNVDVHEDEAQHPKKRCVSRTSDTIKLYHINQGQQYATHVAVHHVSGSSMVLL